MQPSLYLINPAEKTPGYHSMEVLQAWRIAKAVNFADLSTTTIAALAPRDWRATICDERIQGVDFATQADVIGITGKVSQRDRMIELASKFRRRGKLVVMGGPYATLNPEDLRPHTDILVRGEIEEIAGRLFSDLAAGRWEKDYEGTKPDLSLSPVPRWDLYPRRVALTGQVQTSRGCPFECEFCDVIQYLGRKQRWKDPEQVVRELDVLYELGFRDVFFADDNFTVMRRRTHALLERVARWNRARPAGRVRFSTQASIDLARDEDLLRGCAEAGLTTIFVGIETPNQESLAETHKRQNMRVDLAGEVRKIVQAGVMVTCGIIVGFDHDDSGIFERQAEFIDTLAVPIVSLGLLVAPAATPLYARMQKEGRIIAHGRFGAGGLLETNIRPKLMSEAELKAGAAWLTNRIYSPESFGRRLRMFAEASPTKSGFPNAAFAGAEMALAQRLAQYGPAEQNLLRLMQQLASQRPELRAQLSYILLFYCQVRFMLDHYRIWNQAPARRPAPAFH
jgi:radical SAM superfamily enzyme YgiQ (UPF0313 family)